ncbi:NAD(P)H-hydrate dehydratase [Campylobacter sp. RM16188]|uniref:NAD(P)H-hydrate dehydratase n=1 Tax=Campylobacter sp. RM16188 TaxID=1705725 RepID=UPI0015524E16|nr:NAD(P)H-hydrate dehydratase [Campylobacter sp. RM16188]
MKKLFLNTSKLDETACLKFGLSNEILMENAANALAKHVHKRVKKGAKILGVCGSGNNAADVAAALRMLSGEYECELFLAFDKQNETLKTQLDRAFKLGVKPVKKIGKYKCIIDGIFGSGLNRNLDKKTINLINSLNEIKAYKIACDIPSGLNELGNSCGAVFKSDITITMGAAKIGLYSDFAKDFTGKIKVADLGLAASKFEGATDTFRLLKSDMNLPFRIKANTNKSEFGHVFIVSGELSGAAQIAGKSALAMGAGLVSIVSESKNLITDPLLMNVSSITEKMAYGALGMGLGKLDETKKIELFNTLKNKKALVLDADMCYEELTIELLKSKKEIVITPHPKEFCSLLELGGFGKFSVQEVQENRFEIARMWSKKFPNVLVLKGANTIIAFEGKIYLMPYGSAALAKAGSGDALSGIIISLLAQGYTTLDAAISGTLAHALSVRKSKRNNYSITPKDIIKGLKWLRKK